MPRAATAWLAAVQVHGVSPLLARRLPAGGRQAWRAVLVHGVLAGAVQPWRHGAARGEASQVLTRMRQGRTLIRADGIWAAASARLPGFGGAVPAGCRSSSRPWSRW